MTNYLLNIKHFINSNLLIPSIFWILFIGYWVWYRPGSLRKRTFANKIPLFSLFLIIILVSPPLLEIVSLPLYRLTPENMNQKAEAIVVLGGGVDNFNCPTPFSMRRAYTGSRLLLEEKAPILILSTGRTNQKTDQTEAKAMEIIALGLGVPKNKIILEEKSSNTITNALETYNLLKINQIKSIILVTSSHHLYRAMKVFIRTLPGITIFPYASEKKKLTDEMFSWGRPGKIFLVLYEYAAIIVYKTKGWL
jgi:uncharacterized SAM-binding protein YcdF (DUF218 family)